MTQSRLAQALALTTAVLTLAACGSPHRYQNTANVDTMDSAVSGPTNYRGTESGAANVGNNDAIINSNVINALSSVPGLQASSLQVGTLHGIVTLRGTVANQAAAQSAVQTARQVPGVQTVNYDLQVR